MVSQSRSFVHSLYTKDTIKPVPSNIRFPCTCCKRKLRIENKKLVRVNMVFSRFPFDRSVFGLIRQSLSYYSSVYLPTEKQSAHNIILNNLISPAQNSLAVIRNSRVISRKVKSKTFNQNTCQISGLAFQ